ncbi:MAG: LysM peptidoglycan-binding domain-containing protein [Verrucomicrobiota bacterium]|nr:LysM peptidoglycan-binding domain-containing protein [Verrucomicrobiota bacterium]
MKIFLPCFLVLAFAVCAAHGQPSATQDQIDQINGQIQNLLDAQAAQAKRLDTLEREINDLRDKVNQPAPNNYASTDDLKALAQQVQEIDRKRQDDNDRILKELQHLEKTLAAPPVSRAPPEISTAPLADNASTPGGKQNGYYYEVKSGDTLSAIARAYRDQMHLKVTVADILKANPKLDAKSLKVGQKIFVPATTP